MDCRKIVRSLKTDHFIKIDNEGNWFGEGTIVYAKEIKDNIFLLFIISKDIQVENIQAIIARFDGFRSIGFEKPKQIMFYLSIKEKEDLHYFEKFLRLSNN